MIYIDSKGLFAASLLTLSMLVSMPLNAQHFTQINLVTDTGAAGTKKDANLRNVWGLSRSSGGPWWVSDNGSNKTTLYAADGSVIPLVVSVPGGPTGTIFNYTSDFMLGSDPAAFVFAAEDGSISAWNGGLTATVMAMKHPAVYKGLAIASFHGSNYLYAANFRSGTIDVFDQNYHFVTLSERGEMDDHDARGYGPVRGEASFSIGTGWRGYAPFNVQNLGGTLYVCFAKQDSERHDEVDGAGMGVVAAFTTGGKLLKIFEHGPWLNAPWGLALAPGDFGPYSHHLLVGNFGSGQIAAYNLMSGSFDGLILDAAGKAISIDGLWGLSFGNGAKSGALNALYFGAGPNHEASGLFGMLTALDATEGNSN